MAREYLRIQFTFTDPADVKAYGSEPYLYDEYALIAMPARALADLEELIGGTPIPEVMNGVRASRSLADLQATWIAMQLTPGRPDPMPSFDDYNPHTMAIAWEAPSPELLGKALAASTPEASEPVSLPSLPRADSRS